MMREFKRTGRGLEIRFDGAGFSQELSWVRALPGRAWDTETKCWVVPFTEAVLEDVLRRGYAPVTNVTTPDPSHDSSPLSIDLSKDFPALRPYQVQGITWLFNRRGRGLMADEMGLGKTVQAAVYLSKARPDKRPVVIVCPASLKRNWYNELKKWTGQSAYIIYGRSPVELPPAPFYIINYEILGFQDPVAKTEEDRARAQAKEAGIPRKPRRVPLVGWIPWMIENMKLGGWVADEAHYLANPETIQTRAFLMLHRACVDPWIALPMTGTPINTKPADMFTILSVVYPQVFNNRWKYLMRYCGARKNHFGWEFNGASNMPELRNHLDKCMLRRLKMDVLTELPPKQRVVVPMDLNRIEARKYLEAGEAFRRWFAHLDTVTLEAEEKAHDLARLAYAASRESVIEWVKIFLDSGQKLVLGAWYHTTLDDLHHVFKDIAVFVDGSTPSKDRQDLVDRFQADPKIRLFIGQIKAAGVGLTLTAASAVALVEFGQTPGQHVQFEDRVHRFGQTADSVTAYYLLASGTIHEDMMQVIQERNQVITAVLDKREDAEFFSSGTIIGKALKSMKEKV